MEKLLLGLNYLISGDLFLKKSVVNYIKYIKKNEKPSKDKTIKFLNNLEKKLETTISKDEIKTAFTLNIGNISKSIIAHNDVDIIMSFFKILFEKNIYLEYKELNNILNGVSKISNIDFVKILKIVFKNKDNSNYTSFFGFCLKEIVTNTNDSQKFEDNFPDEIKHEIVEQIYVDYLPKIFKSIIEKQDIRTIKKLIELLNNKIVTLSGEELKIFLNVVRKRNNKEIMNTVLYYIALQKKEGINGSSYIAEFEKSVLEIIVKPKVKNFDIEKVKFRRLRNKSNELTLNKWCTYEAIKIDLSSAKGLKGQSFVEGLLSHQQKEIFDGQRGGCTVICQ